MTKFYCNLSQTEINFTNSDSKRVTVKFHAHNFETEDAETIKFLGSYQGQGVIVSKFMEGDKPEVDYTPVFKEEPVVRIKSTVGKRR